MAEKANIIVNYEEEWFDEYWWHASLFCASNSSKGCAVERTFARFQVQEDADKFKGFKERMVS